MTRLWTTLALGLAATSPAFAQSAGSDHNTTPTTDATPSTGTPATPTPSPTDQPNTDQPVTTTPDVPVTSAPVAPPPETTVVASTRDTTYTRTVERERMGLTIAAGGGASGFTSGSLRDTTNNAGDWDVRLTFGSRAPLAFEASYIGSAQRISALGLNNNSMLVGNGAQGALRLNLTTDLPVQPFIFGGAAWRRYTVTNNNAINTSDVANRDDVMEFPVGAGIAGKFAGLVLDARGEFRYTTNADLISTTTEPTIGVSNSGTMHRWGVNANIGYEF